LLRLDSIAGCTTTAYADDLTVVVCSEKQNILVERCNTIVSIVTQWSNVNGVKVNQTKSNILPIKCDINTLTNCDLKAVNNTKILGLRFDTKLTFTVHLNERLNKAYSFLNFSKKFYSRQHLITARTKVLWYTAAIRPMLMYGCEIWHRDLNQNSAHRSMPYKRHVILPKLNSLQHQWLRCAIGGFRTISVQ